VHDNDSLNSNLYEDRKNNRNLNSICNSLCNSNRLIILIKIPSDYSDTTVSRTFRKAKISMTTSRRLNRNLTNFWIRSNCSIGLSFGMLVY